MVKLSLITTLSISTLGGITAATFQQQPAILQHIHHDMVQKALNLPPPTTNGIVQHKHRFTQAEDNCPGTPLLWKINDESGKHRGFAVGTMHLPADVVLTEKAYTSILAAIEDSCDVYGELNTLDTNVTSVIEACATPIILNSATLLDIPDEQLQDEVRAKLLEVVSTYIEPNMEVAQVIASRLEPLPLAEIQRMILYANTPEYMANHSVSIYTDTGAPSLDVNMLLLGRPADDIEEPEDQCELLPVLYPSADEYKAGFAMDPEVFSQDIRDSLDLSLSNEIEIYKCGDIDAFVAANTDGAMFLDEVTNDQAITIRNQNMAKKIVDVLAENQNERILFAVGAAHWQIGNEL